MYPWLKQLTDPIVHGVPTSNKGVNHKNNNPLNNYDYVHLNATLDNARVELTD